MSINVNIMPFIDAFAAVNTPLIRDDKMQKYEVSLCSVTTQTTERYSSSNLFPPFLPLPLTFCQLTRQPLRIRLNYMRKNQNNSKQKN